MPRDRGNAYDALRLLAALAVVVQHATAHLDAPLLWLQPGGAWWFYDGVAAFFIISGLFVFRSAERLRRAGVGWSEFYRNRVLRIAPALHAYLLLVVALVVGLGVAEAAAVVSRDGAAWVLSTLLLAPVHSPGFLDGFGVGHVNGSLWTIPVECGFYAVVPLLVVAAARLGRAFIPALLALAALLLLASAGVPGWAGDLLRVTVLPHLWFFALGITWHRVLGRVPLTWPAALVATLAYAGVHALGRATDAEMLAGAAAAVPLSYVIVCVGERGPRVLEAITRRLGDVSFGTYIWHMVVVNTLLWTGLDESLPEVARVTVVLAVSLALGWLSWRFVERPALARKRSSSRTDLSLIPADLASGVAGSRP